MSAYRVYKGLHGEDIRVPENTIAPAPYEHGYAQYPFAVVADRSGDRRDSFASFSQRCIYIDDAARHPLTRLALQYAG